MHMENDLSTEPLCKHRVKILTFYKSTLFFYVCLFVYHRGHMSSLLRPVLPKIEIEANNSLCSIDSIARIYEHYIIAWICKRVLIAVQ